MLKKHLHKTLLLLLGVAMIYGFSTVNDRPNESSRTPVEQNIVKYNEPATNYHDLSMPNAGPVPEGLISSKTLPTNGNITPDVLGTAFAFQTFPTPTRWVNFPIPGYTVTEVSAQTFVDFASSGTFSPDGNTFYMTTAGDASGTSQLFTINTTTGVATLVGNMTGGIITGVNGITYDPTTGIYYVVSGTALATINVSTAATTLVGPLGNTGGLMAEVAADCDGNMYGIDLGLDNLYSINKSTGAATLIGPLGFNLNFGCGATYDKVNNILYLFGLDGAGNINALRTVNTTTGAATVLHTWNPTLSQFAPFDIVGNICPSGPPPVGNKFVDSLNGANDTNALKSRGYKVYYRGTGPQGSTATWFQGNSAVFPAFNGPATGYVAANFNAVTSTNNIDNWLVLPALNIAQGDTLSFYERSTDAATWVDSMRVMYSATGDSTPEGTWVELGRFQNSNGSWNQRMYFAPTAGPTGRFALRYCVVNGGPSGSNSDFIGVDYIQVNGTFVSVGNESELTADQFALSQNYPNPFNPTTKISFSLPETGLVTLKVYDVMGREVATLVNDIRNTGVYTVEFNGANYSSGIYFVSMQSGDFSQVRRMVLVK